MRSSQCALDLLAPVGGDSTKQEQEQQLALLKAKVLAKQSEGTTLRTLDFPIHRYHLSNSGTRVLGYKGSWSNSGTGHLHAAAKLLKTSKGNKSKNAAAQLPKSWQLPKSYIRWVPAPGRVVEWWEPTPLPSVNGQPSGDSCMHSLQAPATAQYCMVVCSDSHGYFCVSSRPAQLRQQPPHNGESDFIPQTSYCQATPSQDERVQHAVLCRFTAAPRLTGVCLSNRRRRSIRWRIGSAATPVPSGSRAVRWASRWRRPPRWTPGTALGARAARFPAPTPNQA